MFSAFQHPVDKHSHNMKTNPMPSPRARAKSAARFLLLAIGLAFPLFAGAQINLIMSSTVSTFTGAGAGTTLTGYNEYRIADSATLTLTRSGTGIGVSGGHFTLAASSTLIIGPQNSTGMVVFENNNVTVHGGAITMNTLNAYLDITNGIFRNNHNGDKPNNGVSGAVHSQQASNFMRFTNVVFDNNGSYGNTGVLRITGTLIMNNVSILNNWASGDHTGVINMNGTPNIALTDVLFSGNRALTHSGVISAGNGTLVLTNATFNDNWAGTFGGGIRTAHTTGTLRFNYDESSGTNSYAFTGNYAGGSTSGLSQGDQRVIDNTPDFAPVAGAGGFYYATSTGEAIYSIASGVSLTIGDAAATDRAYDSIASSSTASLIYKMGDGDLVLNADNSYWMGTTDIAAGRLMLGNSGASLGGVITVAGGATFGGSGTLTTRAQDGSVLAGRTSLTLAEGANLWVGDVAAPAAQTLHVIGDITAAGNTTINHSLFSGDSASKLDIDGGISLTGLANINLATLATGTFTLMEWTGAGLTSADVSSKLSLSVAGVLNSSRSDAALSLNGNSLVATITIINNLAMKWTGAEGAEWSSLFGAEKNWLDVGNIGENSFFYADYVHFDGVSDAANAANRAIAINAAGVTIAGMDVSGTARYEFQGNGGIEARASTGNASFTPTGKLLKTGSGELVFSNNAANTFNGGIEIAGGMITFNKAAQLGTGTSGILFADSGTLRATDAVAGVLSEDLTVAAGKTADLMVDQGGTLSYSGELKAAGAGATLRKTGGGSVLLTDDNTASTLAIAVNKGSLLLAETAVLGGSVTVGSNAILGGVGAASGSVTVASGGILQAGLETAQPGTLTVNNLTMSGGAVLQVDLFNAAGGDGYQVSDRVIGTGAPSITGVNTVDITSFAAGVFNLGNLVSLATAGKITINGMERGNRMTASLTENVGVLQLAITSDQSRTMTWTGNGSATWNYTGTNWTDSAAVNGYNYGDRVRFDQTSAAAGREILIGGSEVRVADMTVDGAASYTFTGGAIHADAANVQHNGITDATGKLVKAGAGTLTFANEKNTFLGGVEIDGGALVIASGDQLATAAATGITFTGNATLRASASLLMDDDILVAAGKTATLDSAGHEMTLAGSLTGTSDATLAKTGAGTVVVQSSMSGFSGTLAVLGGVARAGAANVFSAATSASFLVGAGATLDLDGHDQTLTSLQGAGTVELGSATLGVNITSGAVTFAGGFSGEGTVVKTGAGKWMLSGESSHASGIVLQAGDIGLASNTALGTGPLTLESTAAQLSIEAAGLDIANTIAAGSGTLTIATNGNAVTLSGAITGNAIALNGAGAVTLSGTNSFTKLAVNIPLAIATRAEAASGAVTIANGSTFEFREVTATRIAASFAGDRLLLTNSAITLSMANTVKRLEIGAGSRLTAGVAGALGGAASNVIVHGALITTQQGTLAGNLTVDGGTLEFGSNSYGAGWRIASLALSGTLGFTNGGKVRLDGRLATGVHTAAIAYGGITGTPKYDANQNGMFMNVDIIDGNLLRITAYDMALEPGKDIAASFDAMRATMDAVYSHLGDDFLAPIGTTAGKKAIWARFVGTFSERQDSADFLGYKDNTLAVVIGGDIISNKQSMIGGYIGLNNTSLETTNDATTDIDLPIFGLYAARRFGDYYVNADIAGAYGNADTERQDLIGGRVTGSYKLNSFAASIAAGRVFALNSGQFRPSLGLQYTNLSYHDYEETGPGAVVFGTIRTDVLQAVARIDFSREFKMPRNILGMLDFGLGMRMKLSEKRADIQATLVEYPDTPMPIRGDKFDSNTVMGRLGVRAMITKTTLCALSYEYDYLPSGNHRNTFVATVRQSW